MSISLTCDECETLITVRDEYAGSPVRCKVCRKVILIPKKGAPLPKGNPSTSSGPDDPFGLEDKPAYNQQREYKILSVKDLFLGRFDPDRIEQVVNVYAKRGWVVRNMATASAAGFGIMHNTRDELIILLERDL